MTFATRKINIQLLTHLHVLYMNNLFVFIITINISFITKINTHKRAFNLYIELNNKIQADFFSVKLEIYSSKCLRSSVKYWSRMLSSCYRLSFTNMASITYDAKSLAELELQELESPGGIATSNVYMNLMAIYLLRNDLCNAKFLWKRIPSSIKSSDPELGHLWSVGQKMWLRDFPGIYQVLNRDWPEKLKPIMNELHESTRRRAINLVSKAYSSINMDTFAALVNVPLADVNKVAEAEGWTTDANTKMVTPKKPEAPPDPCLPNQEHLAILTDYVAYLEN